MTQSGSFGTVLIVDDKERNIEIVGTTLVAMGYEIVPATSGEQALARVEARLPDLILLDVLMPGMDGFEVCRQLKKNTKTLGIPIIFLSAADEKNMIVKALKAGGVDYITKPFNKAELLARVRTQVELKRARDQLHGLVQQREELTGMLAHDLKNALFGIKMSAQILKKQTTNLTESAAKSTSTIMQDAHGALDLIDGFLSRTAANRTEFSVKMVEIDLAECADAVVAKHKNHAAEKNIALHWQKPAERIWAHTGPTAVSNALDNLISNALKFSQPNSSVWVSVDTESSDLLVRDEGPGFTEQDKERLFKGFVRLSAKPTGGETSTGLGLQITKRLVELVGGTVSCESEAGKGAEFRIQLPLEPPRT